MTCHDMDTPQHHAADGSQTLRPRAVKSTDMKHGTSQQANHRHRDRPVSGLPGLGEQGGGE